MAMRPTEITKLIRTYQVANRPIYVLGVFESGVTVYSQQVRALNLAFALMESERVKSFAWTKSDKTNLRNKKSIAIIGAGFAGLTVTAGLLKKYANADITIFEERDTLLPLQQGTDSRWLHPRIYDWPADESATNVAMLPILNWTAARASDVVVQILSKWTKLIGDMAKVPRAPMLRLYCNSRHLQVREVQENNARRVQIEWIGERRNPSDAGAVGEGVFAPKGGSEFFDIVILAVGFGLENNATVSYWRNETVGQPSLDQPTRTFLVSGGGDGAIIDLLRLRISQYRQDRILHELFADKPILVRHLRELYRKYAVRPRPGLFLALEDLAAAHSQDQGEFEVLRRKLMTRLRRDTDVILRLRVPTLVELFDAGKRMSFQNRVLVYLLYKCGAFFPTTAKAKAVIHQHRIPSKQIIRRHGPRPLRHVKRVLSADLFAPIKKKLEEVGTSAFSQPSRVAWSGGYFDMPGPLKDQGRADDTIKAEWRKEYLPGATALAATSFCAGIAGMLRSRHAEEGRLRVTLHRAISFGGEEMLQQACEYQGYEIASTASAAGRTFPARNATIGLAYTCRRIVRSNRNVERAN
jgi:hypothetical protein